MEFICTVWNTIGVVKNMWMLAAGWFHRNQKISENMQILGRKVEELRNREEEINAELESSVHHGLKKRKREVENWLRNVQQKKNEVEQIEKEVHSGGYLSRFQLGSLVERNIKEAEQLVEQGRFPEGIFSGAHEFKRELLTSPLVGETTSHRNLEKIWECLMDKENSSIGIYGMGGVGKTTLVTLIHNWLLKETDYSDQVYWVTVSQESSICKLQNDIAKAAGIDLKEEDDEKKRAAWLFEVLKRRKKFVLILDDMWRHFPVEKVGVPLQVNGGKLLLTTRSLDVCRRMSCEAIVKVETLSMEESWDLFVRKLGPVRVLTPPLEDIMKSVAKECAGLPLALITTATSMRGVVEISEWRNALNELRENIRGLNSMESDVLKLLKFSYDRLEDETLQQCFLYCSLFPEDYKIRRNELIVYWIGEGLLDEMNFRQAQFDRGDAIINRLINVCLLESTGDMLGEICVKMHDVVRDMALTVTRANSMFMVKAGVQLMELPREREWSENLERVSMMCNNLEGQFSKMSPNCPRLKTLLLQSNYKLRELPDCFFVHMQNLTVLDMRWLQSLERLPDSITNLGNLKVLLLKHCNKLTYIPSLAKLEKLQDLDLNDTGLKEVPHGLGRLINLKFLDLSYTYLCGLFPRGQLEKLSCLQCLRLHHCNVNVQMEELVGLRKLETLGLEFSNLHKFNSYVKTQHWQRIRQYYFHTASDHFPKDKLQSKEILIANCSSVGPGQELLLPNNMKVLTISGCHNLTSLLDILAALKDADDLEVCTIDMCTGMESIWSWMESFECWTTRPQLLGSLKILNLGYLPSLRILFHNNGPGLGPAGNGTFANLQQLSIVQCRRIRHLFSSKLVQRHLQKLVNISVSRCSDLEDVILVEEQNTDGSNCSGNPMVVFPKLETLKLVNLPKLSSVLKGTMICHVVEEIVVLECPALKKLPFVLHHESGTSPSMPCSAKISGRRQWWESLEWEHPDARSALQPFFVEHTWH